MTMPSSVLCPACLSLGATPPESGIALVNSTLYCGHHAVEALTAQVAQQRGGPKPMFTLPDQPPTQTIAVSPPA